MLAETDAQKLRVIEREFNLELMLQRRHILAVEAELRRADFILQALDDLTRPPPPAYQ